MGVLIGYLQVSKADGTQVLDLQGVGSRNGKNSTLSVVVRNHNRRDPE